MNWLRRLFRRPAREPWWLPAEEYDGPYGASKQQLDPDLWEYGRKSGWW